MQELRTVRMLERDLLDRGARVSLPIGSAILRYDYRGNADGDYILAYVLADFDQEAIDVRVLGRYQGSDLAGVEWSHYMGSAGPEGGAPIFLFETEGVTEEAGV